MSSNLDGYQTDDEWSQSTNSESGHSTMNLQDTCTSFSAGCKQVLDVGHDSDGVGDSNRQVTRTAWRTYNTETRLSLTRERVPSRADMCDGTMPAVGDIHDFNLCLNYNLMGGDVHSQNVVGEDVCDDNIAVEEGERMLQKIQMVPV